jgi:hypothetical protein
MISLGIRHMELLLAVLLLHDLARGSPIREHWALLTSFVIM